MIRILTLGVVSFMGFASYAHAQSSMTFHENKIKEAIERNSGYNAHKAYKPYESSYGQNMDHLSGGMGQKSFGNKGKGYDRVKMIPENKYGDVPLYGKQPYKMKKKLECYGSSQVNC